MLPAKNQEIYEQCLTAILDASLKKYVRPNYIRVVVDYEVAIHNAARSVLSKNINKQGCFYHLTQSTWIVQAEGPQVTYKSDQDIRNFCGMLDALAFLPVD